MEDREVELNSTGLPRMDRRVDSLERRGLLNEREKSKEFREVYRYTSEFILPIVHHWVERILDDFVESSESNKYLLFYLRDAYPALQIAKTIAQKGNVPPGLIIPAHISSESIKDSRVSSYLARILPKEAVRDKISLWHVDTGVYGSIQDNLILQFPIPPDQLTHHLCLLEYIKERYGTHLMVKFRGGDVHPYYEPQGNEHILIHLAEGLFNLGPKVVGYEPNSLRPRFEQQSNRAQRYVWEHAARVAIIDYCKDLATGKISRISPDLPPQFFINTQFDRLEEMVDRWGEKIPSFLKQRIDTFRSFRKRERQERTKTIITLLKTREKTYIPRTPLRNREDAPFYSLFNPQEEAVVLADYDDLLKELFAKHPRCRFSFNPQKGRLVESTDSVNMSEEPGLKSVNEFIYRCVSEHMFGTALFDLEEGQVRLKQREIYVLLQKLDKGEITREQMLLKLGTSRKDFKIFYRRAMKFWHPDIWRNMGLNVQQNQTINRVTQQLNSLKEN